MKNMKKSQVFSSEIWNPEYLLYLEYTRTHRSHMQVSKWKMWRSVNGPSWPSRTLKNNNNNNNNNNNLVWWHCHRVALYKMWYKLKSACSVLSMLNQIDVFLSALQMYLNQKRKTSNQQAKHSNCWGQKKNTIYEDLVRADVEMAFPRFRVLVQETVDHTKDLLHHSVLPQIVFALRKILYINKVKWVSKFFISSPRQKNVNG